mmetsp:Transcript_3377/g.6477  ORF Transcript_3377/g.6477 Transcript_3377/m.6477 type:complete len:108 (+) Transcript_3377:702-1025(+)
MYANVTQSTLAIRGCLLHDPPDLQVTQGLLSQESKKCTYSFVSVPAEAGMHEFSKVCHMFREFVPMDHAIVNSGIQPRHPVSCFPSSVSGNPGLLLGNSYLEQHARI